MALSPPATPRDGSTVHGLVRWMERTKGDTNREGYNVYDQFVFFFRW